MIIFFAYVLPAILIIIFLGVVCKLDPPTHLDVGDVAFGTASVFVPIFNIIMVGVAVYLIFDKYKSKVVWTRK